MVEPNCLAPIDLIGSPARVQGIKGVWGSVSSSGMCFGVRGTPDNPQQYYARVRPVAERAAEQPFIITVGAGSGASADIRGRARDIVRVGSVYGPTAAILGEAEGKRLNQWPVAVTAPEVYRIQGNPHLVRDLGFPDLSMFSGLMDGVIRPAHLGQLWEALKHWPLERVVLPLANNIYDDGQAQLIQRLTHGRPRKLSAEEGRRLWKEQLRIERDKLLAATAKAINFEKYGIYKCEACEFSNGDKRYFDAHHPTPLSVGTRITLAADLQILCPICHRRAHARGFALAPFALEELQGWVANGRP